MKTVKQHLLLVGYLVSLSDNTVDKPIRYGTLNEVLSFAPSSIREALVSLERQGYVQLVGTYGQRSYRLTRAGIGLVESWLPVHEELKKSTPTRSLVTGHPVDQRQRATLVQVLSQLHAVKLGRHVWSIEGTLSDRETRELLRIANVCIARTTSALSTYEIADRQSELRVAQQRIKKLESQVEKINEYINAKNKRRKEPTKSVRLLLDLLLSFDCKKAICKGELISAYRLALSRSVVVVNTIINEIDI